MVIKRDQGGAKKYLLSVINVDRETDGGGVMGQERKSIVSLFLSTRREEKERERVCKSERVCERKSV